MADWTMPDSKSKGQQQRSDSLKILTTIPINFGCIYAVHTRIVVMWSFQAYALDLHLEVYKHCSETLHHYLRTKLQTCQL